MTERPLVIVKDGQVYVDGDTFPERRRHQLDTGYARRVEDLGTTAAFDAFSPEGTLLGEHTGHVDVSDLRIRRIPYQGWELETDPLRVELPNGWERARARSIELIEERRRRRAAAVLLLRIALALLAAVLALIALLAGPRSAAVIPPVETSVPASAADRPATLEGAGQQPTGAPSRTGALWPRVPRPWLADGGDRTPPVRAANPRGAVGAVLEIAGVASWYCNADPRWPLSRCTRGHGPDEFVAAINPAVVDLPLGTPVVVSRGNDRVAVTIVDRCDPCEATIDLTRVAFSAIADPADGEVIVIVSWGEGLGELPATDVPDQHPQDPPEHPDDARMRLEVLD